MVGRVISHDRILEEIGEGGMGVVYGAEDLKLNCVVALKFLRERSLDDDERKRFFREAYAASSLQRPNICATYEVDEVEGQVFFAMAFVEGRTLAEILLKALSSPRKRSTSPFSSPTASPRPTLAASASIRQIRPDSPPSSSAEIDLNEDLDLPAQSRSARGTTGIQLDPDVLVDEC